MAEDENTSINKQLELVANVHEYSMKHHQGKIQMAKRDMFKSQNMNKAVNIQKVKRAV